METTAAILSPSQLDEMATLGYVVLDRFFDEATIAKLEADVSVAHKAHEEALKAEGGAQGINRAGEILFSSHVAEGNEDVKAFCTSDSLVALTTQLLGPDVDLYWNQTVYKNPESTKEFPWHQDDAYTPVIPSPYLTLWLAITDATVENGCISVLPGSHVGGLKPHWQSDIGWVGHSSDDPDQGIKVPVARGSMIVFWSTTLHKSGPNVSDHMRKAYVIQYCPEGLRRADNNEVIQNQIKVARGGNKV